MHSRNGVKYSKKKARGPVILRTVAIPRHADRANKEELALLPQRVRRTWFRKGTRVLTITAIELFTSQAMALAAPAPAPAAFLQLPLDIHCEIVSFIPLRPRLRSVSLVCRRFRCAVLHSVEALELEAVGGEVPAPPSAYFDLFPSLTELRMAGDWHAPFRMPTQLQKLKLWQVQPADVEPLPHTLTHLTFAAIIINATSTDLFSDGLLRRCVGASVATLATLQLVTSAKHTFQWLSAIYLPSLTRLRLDVHRGEDATYRLVADFIAAHRTQLVSLRLCTVFKDCLGELLAPMRFPALQLLELKLGSATAELLGQTIRNNSQVTDLRLLTPFVFIEHLDLALLGALSTMHQHLLTAKLISIVANLKRFRKLCGLYTLEASGDASFMAPVIPYIDELCMQGPGINDDTLSRIRNVSVLTLQVPLVLPLPTLHRLKLLCVEECASWTPADLHRTITTVLSSCCNLQRVVIRLDAILPATVDVFEELLRYSVQRGYLHLGVSIRQPAGSAPLPLWLTDLAAKCAWHGWMKLSLDAHTR